MAESPLDRLKRLAAEKKAVSVGAQPVVSVGLVETKVAILSMQLAAIDNQVKAEIANESSRAPIVETGTELQSVSRSGDRTNSQAKILVETQQPSAVSNTSSNIGTSDHPLAMQFAELEAALLSQQPEFKTILRQIHRHLGQEPELVTQMTEQEIQMIVSGLVVFANAEIVAPAVAKTAKAAIKAAKAKPISADDL